MSKEKNLPARPKIGPYAHRVEAGKTYAWCACGLSKSQPICDGSHQGSGISPIKFVAPRDQTKFFCGCKASKHAPMCDGAHNKL